MKLDKLFDTHVITGIALGGLIGLYFPLGDYKLILTIVAVVMVSKVVGIVK